MSELGKRVKEKVAPMPSVEMRRSTRVFVPKAKDNELVRVLRSGRRLMVDSAEVKHRVVKNGDEWYPLISDCNNQKKINGWHDVGPRIDPMDVDEAKPGMEICDRVPTPRNDMFRNVYSRKRKRLSVDFDSSSKKFGLHFVRRRRRRRNGDSEGEIHGFIDRGSISFVLKSSCVGCCLFTSVLSVVLRYVSRDRIGLAELSRFLVSCPISDVFASAGIDFEWSGRSTESKGSCRIFGVKQLIAMFTVDFMAAPMCFLQIHATFLFRSVRLSCLCWFDFRRKNGSTDEPLPYINDQSESAPRRLVDPATVDSKNVKSISSSSGAGKLCSRNVQGRIGVLTRSASKRRRRSLRNRRARNPSPFVLHKSTGLPLSNHAPKKISPALPLALQQELRRSVRKSTVSEIHVQNTGSLGVNVDIDSQCCSVNVLVVETEKCYRVEGAEVMLDISASNEWVLVVKKDGSTRFFFKVQREMRPCTTNRFTHAVIWAGENGWKLEFPERKNWVVFKELHKVCGERNFVPTSPVVKIIPVPGVCEVSNLWDSSCSFKRPESYIRMTSDELSRTLSRRTANYDMDSEDEDWLNKFNSDLEASTHLSDDRFELTIDAFEKASYCSPEDVNDEKAAANLCLDLISTEVAVLVYRYWTKKRKQKRAPLNRVFQLNQPTRAQLISKPVLRKKRSLKRPTILSTERGRGKDSTVLQVIAAEHNAAEEQSAILRIQEAKASAEKSVELAILKRQRAQLLMENADLAMYRATMAIRIADAAGENLDLKQAADHFLD